VWATAAILLLGADTLLAADMSGVASVIDGDTIEIHGRRIRIFGIDAPESTQLCRDSDSLQYRCGAAAANQLASFLERRAVTCTANRRDFYGRDVATCSLNGVDIGEWLVRGGHALDWPKYSKGRYANAQNEAEKAERAIWAGSFSPPWRYRECVKEGGAIADCSDQ